MNQNNKAIGLAGVFTAIAASICCIVPVLAVVAGVGGLASAVSWIEPFRPYFIGATAIILGVAWYQLLKPKKEEDCCDIKEHKGFLKSKKFLFIITVLAIALMAFPYYSKFFFPKVESKSVMVVEKENIEKVQFSIEGMTCEGCENHVSNEVNKLSGITSIQVSYKNANAIIEFDSSKVSVNQIIEAIKTTGYEVQKISYLK